MLARLFTRWRSVCLAGVLAHIWPLATQALTVPCMGLAGCTGGTGTLGDDPGNLLSERVIPVIAAGMLNIAAGLALVFVVISGYKMVISAGDDSKFNSGRQGIIFSLVGLAVAVSSSSFISYVISENYGQDAGFGGDPWLFLYGSDGLLGSAISVIMLLMNITLFLMVMYGGIQMVMGGGKTDAFQNGWKTIRFAAIGAIVVNIARWLVEATLFTIV